MHKFLARVRPSLVALATVGATVLLGVSFGLAQPPADRKVITGSVTPLPADRSVTPTGLSINAATADDKKEKLDLVFSLGIPADAQAKLEARILKGEVVPPEQIEKDFSPKASHVENLVKWLKSEGFEIRSISPNRTGVYARATASQIEKSLQVEMVQVTREGVTYTAARNDPSLPTSVSEGVHAVVGLQQFRQMRKQSRRHRPADGNRLTTPSDSVGDSSASIGTNTANAPPYLISEILKAYGADGLHVTGAGQKIAILIDTVPNDSDLKHFWKANGLPGSPKVEKINVQGGPLPPVEGEETLDVEWSGGIASGATVRVYATGSLQFVALDRALDQILTDASTQPGMRQLSISLGLSEAFMGGPAGEVKTQHDKFVLLAGRGINVFVSSGDAGSNPDATGHHPTGPTRPEFEASDPFVTGVGGTRLFLGSTGDVSSERGWIGSGGGVSIFFARPPYQVGPGIPTGANRLIPDVSLAADPNTGAFIFLNGQPDQIGGTSWSAPAWAGFCALMNEARIKAGKPTLPFLNPLIYPLRDTACFRDITSGNNGAFNAGPHFDLVTGMGVPNVSELIKALTK